MHQHCLNWFAEGRSSYDKAKLYLGKSNIAVIIAFDEEEENLEEKVEEKDWGDSDDVIEEEDIGQDKKHLGGAFSHRGESRRMNRELNCCSNAASDLAPFSSSCLLLLLRCF